jgi:succinate dehydrogenase / fumarate reductase cytochrome b subunit
MTTTTSDTAPSAAPSRGALLPRLGSLLAFAPLGVWMTLHLWNNLAAFNGAEAWEAAVARPSSPLSDFIISVIVLLPLVLHSIWGIRRLLIVKPNLGQYRNYDNLKFILQRITALGVLAFLPAHIWLAKLSPRITHGRPETFAEISHEMHHHGPTLFVYLLGILGTAYHFANGLSTGGMTWGYAATPRAMKRMNVISIVFFLVLLAMGWGTVFAMWRAGA